MIGAPQAPAPFDALDDAAVAVLDVIMDAIGRSAGVVGAAVSYERLCERIGIGRNALAASLRTLAALGLIAVTRANADATSTGSQTWCDVSADAAQAIAADARKSSPRKRGTDTTAVASP